MSKIMSIFILFLITYHNAFSSEINVNTKIDYAKFYLNGAELYHSAKLNLDKGVHDLIIRNLVPKGDKNLQAFFDNSEISIISMNQWDSKNDKEYQGYLKRKNDSIASINEKLALLQAEIEIIDADIDFLVSNKVISGKDKLIGSKELKEYADFYSSQHLVLKKKKLELLKLSNSLKSTISHLQSDQQTYIINNSNSNYLIKVQVSKKCETEIKLKYFVANASWSPYYEMRFDSKKGIMKYIAKANIVQNSGIDWTNIGIILSSKELKNTTLPSNSRMKAFFAVRRNYNDDDSPLVGSTSAEYGDAYSKTDWENQVQVSPLVGIKNKVVFDNQIEYESDQKYDILSGISQSTIIIDSKEIESRTEYYALPIKSNNVFRVAYLNKENSKNIINSIVDLYIDAMYFGKTRIEKDNFSDEIKISLGVVEDLAVDIIDPLKKDEDIMLSSNKETNITYKIRIKNNRKEAVNVIVEDLIPISETDEIVVELKVNKTDYDKYDKINGLISRNIKLNPGEMKLIDCAFSIKYPGKKELEVK